MTGLRPVNQPPESQASTPRPSPAIAADGQAIRDWLFSPMHYPMGRLSALVKRALGISETSWLGAVAGGVAGAAVRFSLPLLAGLVVGELAESPVGTWALIAGLLGAIDIVSSLRSQSTEVQGGLFALVATLEHEGDARALLDLTRRRWRIGINAAFGVGFSAASLIAFALWAPASFDALSVGSVVLLGILAFDLGQFGYLYLSFMPGFVARLTRADHRLFWLSPLDSPPVRRMLHATGVAVSTVGWMITIYIVMSVPLVSLDSSLLLPVVTTFTVFGYVAVAVCLLSIRRGIRRLSAHVRDRHLAVLQDRIDGYGQRLGSLTPAENDELRHLVETYRAVREMPTSPSTSETLGHAAKALLIPTLGFFLAVMSEVYAERLLDTLLP